MKVISLLKMCFGSDINTRFMFFKVSDHIEFCRFYPPLPGLADIFPQIVWEHRHCEFNSKPLDIHNDKYMLYSSRDSHIYMELDKVDT